MCGATAKRQQGADAFVQPGAEDWMLKVGLGLFRVAYRVMPESDHTIN